MKRSCLAALALALSLASAAGGLNLAAVPQEIDVAGMRYQELLFKDGARPVAMTLPFGWTFRSSPSRLHFAPPDLKFSEAVVDAVPLTAPVAPWDETATQAAVQEVLASAPPGAQTVQLLGQERDSLMLNGNPSLQVLISYRALGETFWRSVTFVHLPETRVVARFTAREADWRSAYVAYQRAMLSWEWR
jgi:hypothetical protein